LNGDLGHDSLFSIGSMESDSMRPRERRDSGQNDLFKARLDQIVDLNHPLAKLARAELRTRVKGLDLN
jgi:hypothetical protein